MPSDPRIDAHIAKSAAFAQPILIHLRELVHRACPDAEETIKWGRPFYTRDGRMLAMMAAFKAHVTFGFWRRDAPGIERSDEAGGQFGRLTALTDLPADEALVSLIRDAASSTSARREGRKRPAPRPMPDIPEDLADALRAQGAAADGLARLPPGKQREYLAWVIEAKRPETRARRVALAVEQLAEGKSLNWQHERK